MIIDFHNHTYPDKIAAETVEKLSSISNTVPYTNGTAEGLSNDLKESGIDLGIVLPVATAPRQVEKINNTAINVNTSYNNLISFAAMHPDYEEYKQEIKRIKELGYKGIKIHPDYQGCFFDDIKYLNILEEAFKNDLIVVTHAGIDIGLPEPVHCSVDRAINAINQLQLKEEKLVLAHTGGWRQWDQVLDKLCGKNVYFDTAFSIGKIQYKDSKKYFNLMDDDLFIKIVRAHGANKIVFATDSPWAGHRESLEAFNRLSLTKEEKEAILYKTAKSLLNI